MPHAAPPKNTAHLLFEVARLLGRRLRTHFEGTGLHRGQALLLGRLWHGDGVPQSELSRDLHLRAPTVTRMLLRMERDGWITRQSDAHDLRISRVFLTPRAQALQDEALRAFADLEEEFLADLDDSERQRLAELLRKVHRRAIALQGSLHGAAAPKDTTG